MTRTITFVCLTLALLLLGCEGQETVIETSAPPRPALSQPGSEVTVKHTKSTLLSDSVELKRYEVASQALQSWYAVRGMRPALLLYSNDPFLQSVGGFKLNNLLERLESQDQRALRYDITNPAILPDMSVHAALEAGLFSAVYWILPSQAEVKDLSVEAFRTQMTQFGALNAEEARSLSLQDGVFIGKVRGVPFHALQSEADINIQGPVVLHFDLSYLASLYKSEIKTPTYTIIYQVLENLKKRQIESIAATFSYSQVTTQIALGSRFVGEVFEQIFKDPKFLERAVPELWRKRANALYKMNMYMVRDARNELLELAREHPNDPSLHYSLYLASRESKSTRSAALGHLAEAVRLDPVYALEYLSLAPLAREKGRPDEALRMLSLAHEAYPDHHVITLELVSALIEEKKSERAAALLEQLLKQNWSKTFYPNLPGYLDQLREEQLMLLE